MVSGGRSKMGKLEFGDLHLYKMFRYTSRDGNTYKQSQIRGPRRLDGRAITERLEMGEFESEQILGSKAGAWTCALRGKD
jgi:hypothetical protein